MRLYPIHSRYIALLLLVAMLFTLLPAMQTPVSAMEEEDTPAFLDAKDDGVTMLNNGNNIAMSVKINNFGMDGLLFDYLSSFRSGENARHYLWESSGSSVNIQLYPYKTRADLGITLQNNDAQKMIFSDADGFGGGINPTYSLDATSTTGDVSGKHSNGSTYTRTLVPEVYKNLTEQVTAASQIALTDTPYVRLYPSGSKSGESYEKGRAWIKLTTFAQTRKVDEIRYVAIVYRLPHGTGNTSGYSNFGLTVNTMDETTANCSKFATVDPKGGETWQYAIIDLMGLGPNDSRRIASGSNVNTVYLQAPLHWAENNEIAIGSYAGTAANAAYMDIAAVGYFPYYGDAEQFAYYGLTLGSQQKYFSDDNAGFSLRNNTRTYDKTRPTNGNFVHVKSLPTFYTTQFVGARPFGVDTYDTNFYSDNVQDLSALTDVLGGYTDMDVQDLTGINLYGKIKGQAALGLVEPELNANGQPEYRESVVHYIAVFLRNQLLTIPEYPSDNGGWRNYSYITGSSTTGGTDEALFGKNELGQSIDLATALCNQIGVKKGAAITSGLGGFGNESNYDFSVVEDNCHIGTYAKTIAHKDELIGTWAECKENIHTWHDAAYYLLHNLYVTDTDVADVRVDGYGEYEDDYQTLIMPQVRYTEDGVTSTPYFFDSGYAYYTDKADANTWSSAITMNKNDHTITLNADAQGVAQFQSEYTAVGQNPSSWFPFLPTSGNNPAGESNTPYYCHGGAFGRKDIGTTYKNRDFHYALSGEGYFAYEPNLYFNFQGDDDVYVYINGQLVIDIGGTHGATSYSMYLDDYVDWAKGVKYNGETYKGKTYANLSEADQRRVDALCLVTGGVYSFDFFYMERHGVGSNLRIMTNMKIVESSLDVEKHAWQNGVKLMDNGLFDANEIVEYGFSITNNSEGKLYNLSFVDETIGIQMDSENGLTVTGNLTDALGAKLSPAGLVITVDGFDENGNQLDTVNVSCPNNDALIRFLQDLSAEGTQSGDSGDDYAQLYSGSGLWKDATVTVRGIHYRLTEQQKKINSFKNTVTGVAFMKTAGLGGGIEDRVLWGADINTLYQPGSPSYYQWAGRPIVIESEMLYEDLIAGHVVSSADELPDPRDMILIPSNAAGTEALNSNVSNVPGGDVYLKVNYETPGSYMAHVTIRDAKDDNYSITVPITVYALGTQNSSVGLDYGLDSYLTDYDALFKYEMASAAKDDLTGSVLAIGDDTANPSYREYNQDKQVELAAGQINNDLKLVSGTYTYNRTEQADKTVLETAQLSSGIYELEKPIFLDHNKPWVIEWRGKFDNTLLFSTMKKSAEGNTYIYCASGRNGLYIGEHAQEHFKVTSTGTTVSYNNYGLQNSALDSGVVKTYAMVNRPDGAGGNTVYLYVDGTQIGAMNQYHYQNTAWAKDSNNKATNDSWLSGRDFTFNYMGTESHPMNSEYEFIRVYEDGYHLTHFNWQMPDGKAAGDKVINSVSTGETGYVSNAATWKEYTVASNGNHKNYWSLNQPVTLAHDENWELTFTAEQINVGTALMSAQDSSKTNATHIYLYPNGNHQMVHMGFELPDEIGSHTNYGVNICDVIPGFSMTDKHTYVLRNMVQPSGGNMVHLYVDGTYIGPLDSKYWGSANIVEEVTDEISGLDFTFHYLAADPNMRFGYMDDLKLHKLEIRTRPVLSNSYEWVPGGGGLISTVATDPTGNQIVFTADADGVVKAEDGQFTLDSKGLKFAVEDMMDGRYTAYVALAIHDRDFAPTALNVDGIDIRHEVQMYKQVTVLPANVVYYEDDFPAIHYYGTPVNSFAALGNVSTDYTDYSDTKYYAEGSSSGMTQSPDQDIPYGSDGVYQNIFSNSSGSTMHTIAINNDGPLAWFGFKGTGFELDARTSATQAGMIYVEVYKKGEVTLDAKGNPVVGDDGFIAGTPIEIVPVIPQFDIGTMIENRFEMENGGSEAIYQVPIIQYSDLEYGDYIIVISGVETLDYDNNMAHKDTYLYLDGIRIYNPLGTAAVPEYGDEQKVIFEEIRDGIVDGHILVGDYDESKGLEVGTGLMTWTEKYDNRAHTGEWGYVGNAVTDVNDYLMDGPNNEVYLDGTFTNGALVFYVRQTRGADNILQLGVRALDAGLYYGAGSTGMRANLMLGVMGTTASGTTEPGWHYICTVASGTEQYYSIPYTLAPVVTIDGNLYHQVVIKVDAYSTAIPAMVSFTNIKRSEGLAVCESQFIAADKVDAEGNPIVAGEIQGYQLLSRLTTQMSAYRNFTINEAEPGSDFAVETPEVPDANAPVIVPGYPTLAFEGEVRYNIYFNVENMEGIAAGDLGLITFHTPNSEGTVADAVDVIPGALWSGTHYMVHTNGIAAKNLGDTLYFKVYAKNYFAN